MTNSATAQRLAVARKIAAAYARLPKAHVVMVAGSTARGWADPYSDLEVDVFWSEPPTEEERRDVIAAAGGTSVHIHPFEEDEWAETFTVDGVKVDTSTFLASTLEGWLADVCERCDTDVNKQLIVGAVQHGIPLIGHAQLQAWQERANAYPDGLAQAMVQENLPSFERAYYYSMLADRGDALMWHDVAVQTAQHLMGVLLGLNRVYLVNPRYKWLDQTIAMLRIAPADLGARLRRMLASDPLPARTELYALLDETVALVEQHMPEIGPVERWAPRLGFSA